MFYEKLHNAVFTLHTVCDGATKKDGSGFNLFDTRIGKELALNSDWTDKQAVHAYEMLKKYSVQLSDMGIEYDKLPEPKIEPKSRKVDWNGKKLILKFDRDDSDFRVMVAESKALPGRWFNWDTKENEYPLSSAQEVKNFAKKWNFTGTKEVHSLISTAITENAFQKPIEKPKMVVELASNGKLVFQFEYDQDIVTDLRNVPGRAWENVPGYDGMRNTVKISADSIGAIKAVASKWHFEFTDEARQAIVNVLEEQKNNLHASKAADSDFQVKGLGGTPYPFQRAGAEFLVNNPKCFLADEMGLGKTVQSLMAIRAVGAKCSIIICPASLKLNWAREAKKWLGVDARVLEGRKDVLEGKFEVLVVNYDIYHYYIPQLRALEPDVIIFDEAHRIKNRSAKRSQAAMDLVNGHEKKGNRRLAGQRKIPYVWFLTGTPVLNRPNELLHPLSIIDALDNFGGFWSFARRYIGVRETRFGMDFSGAQNLPELNEKLRSFGLFIRRTKTQVLPELPAKQWAVIPVSLTNEKEYRKAEQNIVNFIGERAEKEAALLEEIKSLPKSEREKAIREYRGSKEAATERARQLTEIEALKQLAARGKIKPAVDWIDDFLETGEKLVVFAYHREITEHLANHYNCPFVIGGMTSEKRQEAVDSFQNNPDVKLIICNIVAAGEGLTLTAASNELFLEFAWTPAAMDQASDRCHRIGQKDNVTAWQMIGENTIDEKIVSLIEKKRQVVNAVTEGEDIEDRTSIYSELVEYLQGR